MAILLAEPRTIPNFTTSSTDDLPIKIASKMIKEPIDKEDVGDGRNYQKWIELLTDFKSIYQNEAFPKPRELLKKFDRYHTTSESLNFDSGWKSNKNYSENIGRIQTKGSTLDIEGVATEDCTKIEEILKKLLNPFQIHKAPLDFLDGNYVYYTFSGLIGKQSKIIKTITERKMKLDVLEGKLIEYKDVFDYPDKPNRVSF